MKKMKERLRNSDGAITLVTVVMTMVITLVLLVIFDLCKIFAARESTKSASDATSLAVAQSLIFFESRECEEIANKVAQINGCKLVEVSYNYDWVIVVVEKELEFILVDKFTTRYSRVQSASRTRVIYPWDSRFGYCKSYRFSY